MADEQRKRQRAPAEPDRESHESGIVEPWKNEEVERRAKEHPDGDPAVRRIRPDRGEIPVEEQIAPGVMRVTPSRPKKESA